MIRKTSGITLIETLTVIGIITIVSCICFAAIAPRTKLAAKQAQVKSDLKQVSVAMNLYRADHDDGLPRGWVDLGYFKVNKKDKFGPGYPPQDVKYASPPEYDPSYHTPECRAMPKGTLELHLIYNSVKRFASQPRIQKLDIEQTTLACASWICKPGRDRVISYLRDGEKKELTKKGERDRLSVSMSGNIFFAPYPAWAEELVIGGG